MGKSNKRKLLGSAALVTVSLALLVGLTFAWFTDSVKSTGNSITAGTLGITATYQNVDATKDTYQVDGLNGDEKFGFTGTDIAIEDDGTTKIIDETTWEPGQSTAKLVTVTNCGSLAAKVKLQFDVINDSGLQNALWFDFIQVDGNRVIGTFTKRPMSQLTELTDKIEYSLGATKSATYMLVYGMNENAGNEFQGKSFTANISIVAKQDTVEADGFGNTKYDEGATYPAASVSEVKDALDQAQDGDTIRLTGDLVLDQDLTLNKDITIDGNGKTVISQKPVRVDSNSEVTIKNTTFTAPTNANNNATSVYASQLAKKIVFDGCEFVDFQWEGIQITPVAGADIVINNCFFKNSKTMAESGIETKRYIQVQVTNNSTDISQIQMTLTNNTFENVVQSANGGNGYFSDSVVTIYGVPTSNLVCSGNVFTGKVVSDALSNSSIIWIQDGRTPTATYFKGFSISDNAETVS